jgi:hypothetical protein
MDNFLKWFIIICNSFISLTLNNTVFSLFFLTIPTPNVFYINSNNGKSFSCTWIEK